MPDETDKSQGQVVRAPDTRRPWMNCDALGYDRSVGDEEWAKILAAREARGDGFAVPCPPRCDVRYTHRHVALFEYVTERLD